MSLVHEYTRLVEITNVKHVSRWSMELFPLNKVIKQENFVNYCTLNNNIAHQIYEKYGHNENKGVCKSLH
jgi:hypothetical protein